MKYWTVTDSNGFHVCAPAGFARDFETGEVYKDGTCGAKSAPEITRDSHAMYHFPTLHSAQQQAAKLFNPSIQEWDT